jgi:opacity protein-like surface antigen
MKKFNLSLVAILATSTFALAGGDIAPVEPVIETPVEYDASAFYIGLGYGGMKAKLGHDHTFFKDESDTFNQVMFQAGYNFNEYIAVEGRYYWGTDNNSWNWYDGITRNPFRVGQSVSADSWDIFVKPMYPVTDSFDIYALLGYGETAFNYSWGRNTNFGDTGGFAWGLGVKYDFSDSWSVFVDYVDQADNNIDIYYGLIPTNIDLDFDTWSVGVSYTF